MCDQALNEKPLTSTEEASPSIKLLAKPKVEELKEVNVIIEKREHIDVKAESHPV